MNRKTLLSLCAALLVAACSKSEAPPAAPAAAPAAAPQAGVVAPNTGKVLQVVQAGTYTYAEVEGSAGQRAWIAGSHIEAKVGDAVQWGEYAVMRNFHAKSIDRTFPEILFVNTWGLAGAVTVATPAHGSLPMPGAAAPGMVGAQSSGKVKSVAHAGGYSYVEVDANGSTQWLAVTETPMKAGDTVTWQPGAEMRNFNAKSLGRTFEQITFINGVTVTP